VSTFVKPDFSTSLFFGFIIGFTIVVTGSVLNCIGTDLIQIFLRLPMGPAGMMLSENFPLGLRPGQHTIDIFTTTVDGTDHVDAYNELTISFEEN
jgi:hypothetical protein